MTKVCVKCSIEKVLSEFNNDKTRKDGKFPYCKSCKSDSDKRWVASDSNRLDKRAARSRQWRIDNPEKAKAIVKEWKLNNLERAKFLDKKSAFMKKWLLINKVNVQSA